MMMRYREDDWVVLSQRRVGRSIVGVDGNEHVKPRENPDPI